jgi:uncharacterized protein YecE (DUF72 family)
LIMGHKQKIFIGTSGWNYKSWKKKFYPEELSQKEWLNYYSKKFNSVEINNTFYQLPGKNTFRNWNYSTPDNFIFSVKASRYITHLKKLNDCDDAVKRLIDHSTELGKKLGIFLFQLPGNQHRDKNKLKKFLSLLPDKYRYVFEFRHDSWFDNEIFELLDNNNCGIVINSSPDFPFYDVATGKVCYIRMHGSKTLYSSRYTDEELKNFSEIALKYHKKGYDLYVFFNNDVHGYAVENADTLQKIIIS